MNEITPTYVIRKSQSYRVAGSKLPKSVIPASRTLGYILIKVGQALCNFSTQEYNKIFLLSEITFCPGTISKVVSIPDSGRRNPPHEEGLSL